MPRTYARWQLNLRFWHKVDRRGPDECWPWTGRLGSNAYPVLDYSPAPGVRPKPVSACRILVYLETGEWPPLARHLCEGRYAPGDHRYRLCCNPTHVVSGTPRENALDRVANGRWRNNLKDPGHKRGPGKPFVTGHDPRRRH